MFTSLFAWGGGGGGGGGRSLCTVHKRRISSLFFSQDWEKTFVFRYLGPKSQSSRRNKKSVVYSGSCSGAKINFTFLVPSQIGTRPSPLTSFSHLRTYKWKKGKTAMFWKSVPFFLTFYFIFPEQKSTEAFSSFPQTKEFLCEREKTNRCCSFPPGTFMGKRRRRHLPKSPIWESAVGGGGKNSPPLPLRSLQRSYWKIPSPLIFCLKNMGKWRHHFPPVFSPWWCLHNWDGCCSRRKN